MVEFINPTIKGIIVAIPFNIAVFFKKISNSFFNIKITKNIGLITKNSSNQFGT